MWHCYYVCNNVLTDLKEYLQNIEICLKYCDISIHFYFMHTQFLVIVYSLQSVRSNDYPDYNVTIQILVTEIMWFSLLFNISNVLMFLYVKIFTVMNQNSKWKVTVNVTVYSNCKGIWARTKINLFIFILYISLS